MSGLADTWMTPHKQHGGMFVIFFCFITSEEEVALAETFLPLRLLQTLHPPLHWHSGE